MITTHLIRFTLKFVERANHYSHEIGIAILATTPRERIAFTAAVLLICVAIFAVQAAVELILEAYHA